MLTYLKNEANRTLTENSAVTYRSTLSHCLDLFATVGALRDASDAEIETRFLRAYAENPDLAMKLLFFARDVRGGLGERRVFRTCLKWLADNHPKSVRKNLVHIAEFGRWDDVLTLLGTPCEIDALRLIRRQLEQDLPVLESGGEVSLLAKWLPSVNASNADTVKQGKKIARFLGMSDADYRRTLVKLRERIRIIENNLRERDYSFDYEKQPSKAMFKYRKAFLRNDSERYGAFMERVATGEAKLHTGTLTPYELVTPFLHDCYRTCSNPSFMRPIGEEEKQVLNTTWAELEDFGGTENALAVVDTSGSMYFHMRPLPAAVALSLGLYFAERNKGAFANHFIEFSATPRLIELKGETFADRLRYAASFNEIANTDLQAVFELILQAAVKNHVLQDEMPTTLYIISDMEFDYCVMGGDLTNFELARARFAEHGYELPRVVFWNVASRSEQQPVTKNEQGVALVSGCSPRLFSMLAEGKLSPEEYMLDILGNERYAEIAA